MSKYLKSLILLSVISMGVSAQHCSFKAILIIWAEFLHKISMFNIVVLLFCYLVV